MPADRRTVPHEAMDNALPSGRGSVESRQGRHMPYRRSAIKVAGERSAKQRRRTGRGTVSLLASIILLMGSALARPHHHAHCRSGQIYRVSLGECVSKNSKAGREVVHRTRSIPNRKHAVVRNEPRTRKASRRTIEAPHHPAVQVSQGSPATPRDDLGGATTPRPELPWPRSHVGVTMTPSRWVIP